MEGKRGRGEAGEKARQLRSLHTDPSETGLKMSSRTRLKRTAARPSTSGGVSERLSGLSSVEKRSKAAPVAKTGKPEDEEGVQRQGPLLFVPLRARPRSEHRAWQTGKQVSPKNYVE